MPEYLHPGVYVEEVSSGVRPIEGVGTSTAGFVGITEKGVPNRATFISSWTEFVNRFGYLIPNSFLPYAVSHFFSNGGKKCYIVRALNQASAVVARRELPSRETTVGPRNTLRVSAIGAGGWGNNLQILVQDGTENPTSEFKLVVFYDDPDNPVELFDNLSIDPTALNFVETEINNASNYIEVASLGASSAPANASRTSTNPLVDPVVFAAAPGEDIALEAQDGTTIPVTFAGNVARADVLAALNNAWGPQNISASLTPANRLVVRHNAAGFEHYFILSGAATAAGRPLVGLAGFAQGAGDAIGATVKSAAQATFNIPAGPGNVLNVSVHGDPLPPINLPVGAAVTVDNIVAAIDTAFRAPVVNGLVQVTREGNRVVISTTNRGAADSDLSVGGTADAVLVFRRFDRTGASGATVTGQSRSEPAFVQSTPGPFTLPDGSNFRIQLNNGTLGAASPDITVTFNAAAIPNLQQVSAQTVATSINTAAGSVIASVINNRVVIRQPRRGSRYTLRIVDGNPSANLRLKFETSLRQGYEEGDESSPYLRPGFNFDAQQVNQPWPLLLGDDGSPVSNSDYIGNAAQKTGLHALDDVDDVNFIAIPGVTHPGVIGQAIGYCTVRKDCFFIADAPGKQTRDTPTTEPVHAQNFVQNLVPTKTSYGALYYPWLEITDEIGAGKNPKRFVPPSGFVAGLYARIDNTRGVWKAPAGTEATLIGPLSLEYTVTDAEQDILNPYGVNCVRRFDAAGIVVWGARTIATQSDAEWRYVPVRRYAIYLEQSIYRGTQWAVFEPNDAPLWESLKANIDDFMMGEFRRGALAGAVPEQAFEVKCDADLNPPSEVNAGRVNMEVKFAPLKPAEFVIIRISQKVQRPQS